VKYPPGLPIVYAAIWLIAGTLARTTTWIAVLNVGLVGTAAALLWGFARTRLQLSPWVAAPCIVGPLLLEAWIHIVPVPLGEPFMLLVWSAALVLFARVVDEPAPGRALGAGLVLGTTLLFRTQALPLLAAALAAAALHRLPARVTGTLAVGLFAPISVWHAVRRVVAGTGATSAQPDDWSYFTFLPLDDPASWPAYAIHTWSTILGYYWTVLPNMLGAPRTVGALVLVLATVAAVAGAVWLRKRERFLTLGIAVSLLTVLSWPFAQERMFLIMLPFLGLPIGAAVEATLARTAGRRRLGMIVLFVVLLGAVGWRQVEIRGHAGSWANTHQAVGFAYLGMVLPTLSTLILTTEAWLETSAAPDDVLLFEHGPAPFLTTGIPVVTFPYSDFVDQLPMFDEPGAYLAHSIVDDGVTLVAITAQREPGGNVAIPDTPLTDELLAVFEACPSALGLAGMMGDRPTVAFYRVRERGPCLAGLVQPSITYRRVGPRR
jgi:hypothetical protein